MDRTEELRTIDASNSALPVDIGAIDADGYALEVEVVGDYAHLANFDSGLRAIDISDPTQTVEVGSGARNSDAAALPRPLTPERGSGTLEGPARPADRTGSVPLVDFRGQRPLDWSLSCSESERLNSSSCSES